MPDKPLYFIALIPPEPFRDRAWKLKEYFRDQYGSKASLNSPPHITLFPPFKLEKEEKLLNKLQKTAAEFKPFEICLQNFAAFPPRVIFIDVERQPAMNELQQLVKRLVVEEAEPDPKMDINRPFHPHMTLAFRDLSKMQFKKAWEEFRERELSYCWLAESFTLLRHNGKRWEEQHEIPLAGGS